MQHAVKFGIYLDQRALNYNHTVSIRGIAIIAASHLNKGSI